MPTLFAGDDYDSVWKRSVRYAVTFDVARQMSEWFTCFRQRDDWTPDQVTEAVYSHDVYRLHELVQNCGVYTQVFDNETHELLRYWVYRCPSCDDYYKRYKRAMRVADAIQERRDFDEDRLTTAVLSRGPRETVYGWKEECRVLKLHLAELKGRFAKMRNRQWFRNQVTNYYYVYEFTAEETEDAGVSINSHLHVIFETKDESTPELRKKLKEEWETTTDQPTLCLPKKFYLKSGSVKPAVRYFCKYLTKMDRHRAFTKKRLWHSTFRQDAEGQP